MPDKRYCVMFWSSQEEIWLHTDRNETFDTLNEAREARNNLNRQLSKGHRQPGDRYAVIDTSIKYPFGMPVE